jgi:carotenoid cleavage dioxygenase-like enzyme
LIHNVIEVAKDDSSNFLRRSWRHIARVGEHDIKRFYVKPEFAFHIALPGMDMDGFASFIGVEEQAPPKQQKNSRHMQANSFLHLTRSSAEPVERQQNRLRLERFVKRVSLRDSKPRNL